MNTFHAPTAPTSPAPHPTRWELVCSMATLIALGACGGGSGSSVAATPVAGAPVAAPAPAPVGSAPPAPAAAPTSAPAPAPAAWGSAKTQARVFISGHSLTDDPLAGYLVSIANGLGGANAAKYNQQIEIGSPMRMRTDSTLDFSWAGYRSGKNRSGDNMNVINELRTPATLGGDRYDTLVIAERHDLLGSLQWENTVRYLRHFHERFLAGNPAGRTYFYETWFDISSKATPSAWIAHERAASGAWQCVAARVNRSLEAEGRNDRITPLPMGAALAHLVERATAGNVAGITDSSVERTVDVLFDDNVHLRPVGIYYAALVTYAAIYQRSPVGAPVPSGVSSSAGRSLQEQAWNFVSNFYANYQPPSLDTCRAQVAQNFCPMYWNYRNSPNEVAGCTSFFRSADANNPLHYSAAADASYWYPAPP